VLAWFCSVLSLISHVSHLMFSKEQKMLNAVCITTPTRLPWHRRRCPSPPFRAARVNSHRAAYMQELPRWHRSKFCSRYTAADAAVSVADRYVLYWTSTVRRYRFDCQCIIQQDDRRALSPLEKNHRGPGRPTRSRWTPPGRRVLELMSPD